MSTTVTKMDHWREVYRQQRLKNGQLWLEEFAKTSDPRVLAAKNYDKILQAIEQTLKHEDSFDTGCELLREVFPVAYGMVDWGRWLTYLNGALAMSQQLNNRSNNAYLHEWIGDIELSLNHFEEAEIHFRQALEIYLDAEEMGRYGRNLPQLSRVYAAQGNLQLARELCQEALRLGEKDETVIVIAGARYGLGEIHHRMKEFEEAITQYNEAVVNYELIGKHNFVFRVKTLIVSCKISLGKYKESEAEAEALISLFNNSENAYDNLLAMIHLRNFMGGKYFKTNEFVTAEQYWQEAYQECLMLGSPDLLAALENNLGKVYTALDEFEAADEMLRVALGRFERMGDVFRWANCMDNMVDLYERMGDVEAAKATLEQAIGRLEPEAHWPFSQKLLREMKQRLEKLSS